MELNALKILIVDDTPAVIDVIKDALIPENYQIAVANSGEKALSKIEKIKPDIVLLDILMPGLDGYDTCLQIKKLPSCADLPIIFISALSESFDKVKAFNAGGVDYITKPIQREELLVRVKMHLQSAINQRNIKELNALLEEKVKLRTESLEDSNKALLVKNEELVQVTDQLKEAIKRIDLVIEGADVGTFELQLASGLIVRNDLASRMIGYQLQELGDTNDFWFSLIHPEDCDRVMAVCHSLKDIGHDGFNVSYRIKHKLGHWVWLRTKGKITEWDDSCCPLVVSGVFIDVTAEKSVEIALKHSEERFKILSESTHEGILIHQNGVIVNANKALAVIMGYQSEEDILGQPLPLHLVSDQSLGMVKDYISKQYNGKYEVEVKRRDGVLIDCEFETSDLAFQNNLFRVVAIRDITERKQNKAIAEARLSILDNYGSYTIHQILIKVLEEMEKITKSIVAYCHFVDESLKVIQVQTCSEQTLKFSCYADEVGKAYPISDSPIWAKCIKTRKAVVETDVLLLKHIFGLPPDLKPLEQELVWPIIRSGKVVAIIGVADKNSAYTARDIEVVSQLAEIAWDIIERKQAEEALKTSQQKYRFVFENASVGMSITDFKTGVLLDVNQFMLDKLGYDYDEELQKGGLAINYHLKPELRAELMERLERYGRANMDIPLLKKDKTPHWFSVSYFLNRKQGTIETFLVDIDEKRKAEQGLKESENRFKTIFQKSKTVMLLINPQAQIIVDANDAALDFYGYNRDEFQNKSVLEIADLNSNQVKSNAAKAAAELQNHFEVIHVLKSGAKRNVDVYATPVEIDNQVLLYAIVIDRTKEMQAHIELERINRRFLGLENIIHRSSHSINDLLDYALQETIDYTQSDIGCIYHYDELSNLFLLNNYSDTIALSHQAQIDSVDKLDCLSRAVLEKQAVIVNEPDINYAFVNVKLGNDYLYKSVSIPVIINDKVVAVVWLGSKTRTYTLFDGQQIALLLETTWILVEKQKLQDKSTYSTHVINV